jgi:hypothetical protein
VGEAEVVDEELVEDVLEVDDVLLVVLEVDDVLLVELDVDEEVVEVEEVEEVEETVLDLLCVSHYFSLKGNIRQPLNKWPQNNPIRQYAFQQ